VHRSKCLRDGSVPESMSPGEYGEQCQALFHTEWLPSFAVKNAPSQQPCSFLHVGIA
jgi:hypothetical protein